jgi:hypothetical protein
MGEATARAEREAPFVPAAVARQPRRDLARALLLFAAVILVFFLPAALGFGQFQFRDTGRMHAPHKRFVSQQLARGDLPEWNPHGGLGYPLVAGAVDAVQHPFNLLLVTLPFEIGFTCWALLSVLLAAAGAWTWARQLGCSQAASVAAGLMLALSGFLVSSTDNYTFLTALAATPLVLAAGHAFVARGGLGRAAALGAASGLAAAAGDPQSWGLCVVGLPLYAALLVEREGSSRRSLFLRGSVAAGIATMGAAPFVFPVLAWMPHSSRAQALVWLEHERFNLLPLRLLEFGIPGLFRAERLGVRSALYAAYAGSRDTPLPWVMSEYIGATVLALATLGARRSLRARWLLAAAVVFAWMAMGKNAGFGQAAALLPVLSGIRYWEKLAFFPALLAGAAAALGIQSWLDSCGPPRRFSALTAAAGGMLIVMAGVAWAAPGLVATAGFPSESAEFAGNVVRGVVHAGVALLALAIVGVLASGGRLAPRSRPFALVALVSLDLAAANAGAYVLTPGTLRRPTSDFAQILNAEPGAHRVVTPSEPDDRGPPPLRPFEWAALRGASTLNSGWNVAYQIGNFEPYTGMIPDRAMKFGLRTGTVRQFPMVGMWGVDHAVVRLDDGDPRRFGIAAPWDVAATASDQPALLLRLPHRPRAYIASEVGHVDRRGAMDFVLDPGSVSSRRTVIEGRVPSGYVPPHGSARIVVDQPERVTVEVAAEGPALLVLNDTFAPGWTATVGGAPAEILAANYLARGVWIPAGEHEVTFRYSTPMLREGWLAFLAGALVLALQAVRKRRSALAAT